MNRLTSGDMNKNKKFFKKFENRRKIFLESFKLSLIIELSKSII